MIRVTENLRKIRDLLAQAAIDAGRDAAAVGLLAVSKKQHVAAVREAAADGQLDFGENIAQEGLEKIAAVADDSLHWHFIGRVQSNKTRLIATHFDWVHTVDRLKIAQRLSQQRPLPQGDLNICLQVNIDNEAGKSGVGITELAELASDVIALPRLRLRGLMCLPAVRNEFAAQREPFARLRQLADSLTANGIPIDTLSMGMSADYRAAIVEGSTIVRLGTAIFGSRNQ